MNTSFTLIWLTESTKIKFANLDSYYFCKDFIILKTIVDFYWILTVSQNLRNYDIWKTIFKNEALQGCVLSPWNQLPFWDVSFILFYVNPPPPPFTHWFNSPFTGSPKNLVPLRLTFWLGTTAENPSFWLEPYSSFQFGCATAMWLFRFEYPLFAICFRFSVHLHCQISSPIHVK